MRTREQEQERDGDPQRKTATHEEDQKKEDSMGVLDFSAYARLAHLNTPLTHRYLDEYA
jgi:hypothetical protein